VNLPATPFTAAVAGAFSAIALPMLWDRFGGSGSALDVGLVDGVPMGVQVIGPRDREDLVLDAAAAIERACGTLVPIDPPVAPAPATFPATGPAP
jgi:Asp-tRNA(Asn)/Glu-tRNA(Gln) amidotransferase A subunit family amidase